jgi:hypothetical protein
LFLFFYSQWEISVVVNVAIKLYYEEVPDPIERSTTNLQKCMEKAMELI